MPGFRGSSGWGEEQLGGVNYQTGGLKAGSKHELSLVHQNHNLKIVSKSILPQLSVHLVLCEASEALEDSKLGTCHGRMSCGILTWRSNVISAKLYGNVNISITT